MQLGIRIVPTQVRLWVNLGTNPPDAFGLIAAGGVELREGVEQRFVRSVARGRQVAEGEHDAVAADGAVLLGTRDVPEGTQGDGIRSGGCISVCTSPRADSEGGFWVFGTRGHLHSESKRVVGSY